MFPTPPKTLKHSLSTVLTGAQEYSGDVCFVFDNEQIWAHKALLMARVPEDFLTKYMPQLLDNTAITTIDSLSTTIPYDIFVHLLRFWYTADFTSATLSSTSSPSASVMSSSSSSTAESLAGVNKLKTGGTTHDAAAVIAIRQSITTLESSLQLHLLPLSAPDISDDDQLVLDLEVMRRKQLNCDGMVNIFKPNTTTTKKKPLSPSPSSLPTLTKRHTTPANIATATTSKATTITSILNTASSIPSVTTPTTDIEDDDTETASAPVMITFPIHRFILASRSSYFHSLMYSQQVCESPNSTVLLPYDQFSSTTLDIILHYFYTDQLQVPELPMATTTTTGTAMSVFQKEMNRKKHVLRELQKVFRAADYLGHIDALCDAALYEMESICHRFKCTCSSCVVLLPSMLAFANKHQSFVRPLLFKLMAMYTEPIQALPPLWSQKPFSLLIVSHLDSDLVAVDGGGYILPTSLQSLFHPMSSSTHSLSHLPSSSALPVSSDSDNQGVSTTVTASATAATTATETGTPSSSTSSTPSSSPAASCSFNTSLPTPLLVDLVSRTLGNITKRNAIHVLHSVHLCLSKIRSADPFPTWSQPSLALIHAILHHTISMVSLNFDFYCVEYPILLSCVDGIGGGFSVDFLDFLLKRILNNGIQDSNAAVLYQGIVRDLIGRQEVVKNVAVDGVLLEARQQCVDYLSHRWVGVKAQGGFQSVDKDILRLMADDINVPYRTLAKPIESEFSAMFGFKPKSSNKPKSSTMDMGAADSTYKTGKSTSANTITINSNSLSDMAAAATTMGAHPTQKSRRRLSLGSLRYPRTSSRNNRNRLSAEVRGWMDSASSVTEHGDGIPSTMDFDDQHSLSDNEAIMNTTTHSFHRHLSLQPKRRLSQHIARGSSSASLTDVLLPVDVAPSNEIPTTTSSPNNNTGHNSVKFSNGITRGDLTNDNNAASPTTTSTSASLLPGPRKSRLTFELPETPIRAKFATPVSTSKSGSRRRTRSPKHKYRWGLGGGSKDSASDSGEEDETQLLMPVVGAKVELLRRPLPTLGRIKFIGNVQFSKGTWVGVELESRLGQNDGSVDGVRYFQTDPQRGVFVKMDGLKLISGPIKP
ncbi:hypothetical protein BCR42DRAFT_347382 [Absidia repens]|uniref:BTB domain-containing protein n=1 Tax=Absidia repens TaxID=90262 RepID=A0A1X2IQP8_9FUNG|nr:hypothetical protein BCR42DRAFT_347382 [Absidia repens]